MGYKVMFVKVDSKGHAGPELSETFLKDSTRRKWIALILRQGYEVTWLGRGPVKEGARV